MIAEVYQKEKEQENSMLISLVERIQTGDQQAFLDFYEMTKKAVVFNVRQNGVPERDLEDIVQDIYVKVFKNIASLKDSSSAFGWVRKIAVNTARNYHRKAETKHEELLYEKTGDDGDQLDPFDSFDVNDSMSAVLPMPAEIIDAREGSRMIYDMIMELPEKQGLSLMDYFYNDMSVSEIALSMEVPENTVKSWLRRGKKAMQIKLETLAKEKGIKLYTTVLLPVIAAAFKKQAEAGEVPFSLDKMVRELIALVVAAGAAGGAASGLAGANLAGGLPEKIADNVVHGIEKNHVTGTGIIREPVETGTPLSRTSTPSGADISGKDNVMTAGKGAAENAAETASANGAAMENAASAAGSNITAKAAAGTAGKAAAATLSKGALIKIAAVLMAGVIGGGVFLAVNNSGSNHQEVSVASTDEEAETVFAGNDNTAETTYAYEDQEDESLYAYEEASPEETEMRATDEADQEKAPSENSDNTNPTKNTENSNNEDQTIFQSMPSEFTFTSGAGGWATTIYLNDDGSFSGEYLNSDMGDNENEYPKGTVYLCDFTGKFSVPEKIDDYRYSTKLEYLDVETETGTEYYENGFRYILSDPYGFDDADEFIIYLPGCSLENVSEEFLSWSFIDINTTDVIPVGEYGIYNISGKKGFVGKEKYN